MLPCAMGLYMQSDRKRKPVVVLFPRNICGEGAEKLLDVVILKSTIFYLPNGEEKIKNYDQWWIYIRALPIF